MSPAYKRAIGIALFCVAFALTMIVFLKGVLNNPYAVYAAAARRFWLRQPLYDTRNIDGFQYLPHTALIVSPFAFLGTPAGDLLWRAAGWSLFAAGIWRWAKRLAPERADSLFLAAGALVILPSVASLGIGQANLPIAALMLHAAVELSRARWNRAAAWLAAGLALKPILIAYVLLLAVLQPPMRKRILIVFGILILIPFVFAPPDYVLAQVRDCWTKMGMSSRPDRIFEDLRGLLWKVGWMAPHWLLAIFRLAAAVGVLAIGWRVRRREAEPMASLLVLGLAGAYLMLFNPRTQSNSYVLVAPVAALLAASTTGRARWLFCAILLAWSSYPYFPKFTAYWLKPLACLFFVGLVAYWPRRITPESPTA